MKTIEEFLFRDLPEQSDAEESRFFIQIKSIDRWFDKLPLANFQVSVKTIYNDLTLTNQKKLPSKERLYFLEKIHTTVIDMTAKLTRGNLDQPLPFDNKHYLIELLIQKLHTEIAIAYKYVLQDIISGKSLYVFNNKHLIPLIIARIMRHHSLSLIASYQFYAAPRKGLWSEIHLLFLFAHSKNLLQKTIPDKSFYLIKESTIKRIYLQTLLTALANPYNLTQIQIFAIFKQLEMWSSLVTIQTYQAKFPLLINLYSDEQPTFTNLADMPETNHLWELDTSKLNFERLLDHYESKKIQNTAISSSLLKKLSFSWGDSLKRATERHATETTYLDVAIGIDSIHYVLNNYTQPEWLQSETEKKLLSLVGKDEESLFHSKTIDASGEVNDVWKNTYYPKDLLSNTSEQTVRFARRSPLNIFLKWKLINKSQGGFCLQWDKKETVDIKVLNVKVGQIIAACHSEESKTEAWFVGVICWMKCLESSKIQVGVQVLAHHASAGSVAKFSYVQEGEKTRAILLPEIKTLNQPKTLIVSALRYEVYEQIILDDYSDIDTDISHHKTRVILVDSLDNSSQFTRFSYSLVKDYYKNKQAATSEKDKMIEDVVDDNEFDSIWDAL